MTRRVTLRGGKTFGPKGRVINKLSAVALKKKLRPGKYGDGGGLYLSVRPNGNAYWIFHYMLDGQKHGMGLGGLRTVSLKEAREAARDYRQQLRDGIDPLTARRAQVAANKATKTFRQCAERYWATFAPSWDARYAKIQRQVFERWVFPVFGDLPVQAVDIDLVTRALEPVWDKPARASQLRWWLEAVFGWATVHGLRQGDNPAQWKNRLQFALPKLPRSETHYAALPFDEIADFLAELRRRPEVVVARAVEFTLLTAVRTSEAFEARWDEINLAERLWTIPRERMKGSRREHRVPLSAPALAIIEEMSLRRKPGPVRHILGPPVRNPTGEASIFVFRSPHTFRPQPLGRTSGWALLKRMGRGGQMTVHGFRSTFRDWVAERTAYPDWVAEMALAHAIPNRVEAAYRRGDVLDKRRQLMEQWAAHCTGITPVGGEVVPFRGATPLAG
jgi:integrase